MQSFPENIPDITTEKNEEYRDDDDDDDTDDVYVNDDDETTNDLTSEGLPSDAEEEGLEEFADSVTEEQNKTWNFKKFENRTVLFVGQNRHPQEHTMATTTPEFLLPTGAAAVKFNVHPLVLFNIFDQYSRSENHDFGVIGTLLGHFKEGVIHVTNSFGVPLTKKNVHFSLR